MPSLLHRDPCRSTLLAPRLAAPHALAIFALEATGAIARDPIRAIIQTDALKLLGNALAQVGCAATLAAPVGAALPRVTSGRDPLAIVVAGLDYLSAQTLRGPYRTWLLDCNARVVSAHLIVEARERDPLPLLVTDLTDLAAQALHRAHSAGSLGSDARVVPTHLIAGARERNPLPLLVTDLTDLAAQALCGTCGTRLFGADARVVLTHLVERALEGGPLPLLVADLAQL